MAISPFMALVAMLKSDFFCPVLRPQAKSKKLKLTGGQTFLHLLFSFKDRNVYT